MRFKCVGIVLLVVVGTLELPVPSNSSLRLDNAYAQLPLSFESNQGQSDGSVKFLSRGLGYGVFLTSMEAVLVLSNSKIENPKSTVLRMRLLGANTNAETKGVDELPGTTNYFIGADPEKWHRNIPTYEKVRYSNIYPGIDLMYYGQGRQLEYDFVVAPGADPSVIRLDFEGSRHVRIDPQGDLVVEPDGTEMELLKPSVYQQVMGERREVAAEYTLNVPDNDDYDRRVGASRCARCEGDHSRRSNRRRPDIHCWARPVSKRQLGFSHCTRTISLFS